jgi:hypothetical protein
LGCFEGKRHKPGPQKPQPTGAQSAGLAPIAPQKVAPAKGYALHAKPCFARQQEAPLTQEATPGLKQGGEKQAPFSSLGWLGRASGPAPKKIITPFLLRKYPLLFIAQLRQSVTCMRVFDTNAVPIMDVGFGEALWVEGVPDHLRVSLGELRRGLGLLLRRCQGS